MADFSEDRGPTVLIADLVTRAAAWIAVGLRFWARRRGGSNYGLDDWFILAAAISVVATTPADVVWVLKYNLGRHIEWVLENQPDTLTTYAKILYAEQNVYMLHITCIKLSILFLYIRLFGVDRRFSAFCYAQVAIVCVWAVITQFITIFQCHPISNAWAVPQIAGTCMDYTKVCLSVNMTNVLIDFVLFCTPLYPIWRLKLPIRKRLLISVALLLGVGELIFSIIRLVVLTGLTFEDPTWDGSYMSQWTTIEVNLGICCSCIPVMGPLLSRSWTGISAFNSRFRSGYSSQLSGSRSTKNYKRHTADNLGSHAYAMEMERPVLTDGIQRTTEVEVTVENEKRASRPGVAPPISSYWQRPPPRGGGRKASDGRRVNNS